MSNQDYFLTANPNIMSNYNDLRKVQLNSYIELCHHFLVLKKKSHAVAILPTGSGKTGLMAISPFGIAKGRVLIITPQLVIKDHVLDSLDPSTPDNFWLKHDIFNNHIELPIVTEYDKSIHYDELYKSNIVILNIHKVQKRHRNSLLNKVDKDFFDLIIIDEAHHSPAKTWQDALNHFDEAKVIKVTGTPFRSDRKEIEGEIVVNYRLGQAMKDGIVKTLQRFILKPEKVLLTIDNNEEKVYSIEELEDLGIKDKDYIHRSVAYSKECNTHIVEESIKQLSDRKEQSDVPHKIIAVCCSIKHSQQVKELYEQRGLNTVVIHSGLPDPVLKDGLRKIESHQVEVVIHVAMLGEGYDHPYLSVAAIFRPYRSLAPYSQFIGRILRKIPEEEYKAPIDNIGVVIAHRDLGLEPLWREYQKEQEYTKVIDLVRDSEPKEKKMERNMKNPRTMGSVVVEGEILTDEEFYEYTLAADNYQKYEQEIHQKALKLQEIFPSKSISDLEKMAREQDRPISFNPLMKNPRKYRQILKEEFANKVQFKIPAEIILKFGLVKEDNTLRNLKVNYKHQWTLKGGDNAAIISKYLNAVLSQKFGRRDTWTLNDYLNGEKELKAIVTHLEFMIESLVKE
ncbi:hypothetical protein J14TS2_17610 [Bacillus sp. J14TS2]|uniref:DEAD/DEAH box helicase n=1 Tax=Bacillus sp. J14TS2 TaxID=2807188 RepID=UPI001B12F35F|nr:DEAD/DEAH box helicase family protein [Bacillus sp. J14TS2]GIN71286.1 hypothetical protein J14TS2_17610 [Bacillus sp. J14TS2]